MIAATLAASTCFGVTLVNTFNPARGALNGIAFDPVSGNLFIHPSFDASIREYTPGGQFVDTILHPGLSTNDSDYDFTSVATIINGVSVPANTLLVTNGERDPQMLFAINKDTGAVLATLQLQEHIGQLTGGSYDPIRNELVAMDWSNDVIIRFNINDGTQVDNFSVGPDWDAYYSDVAVEPGGFLVLVSSSQNTIRILNPNGNFITDVDVGALGISGMSGIALDPNSHMAYISSTNGNVYQIDGLGEAVPEPTTWALMVIGGGMSGLFFYRRSRKKQVTEL